MGIKAKIDIYIDSRLAVKYEVYYTTPQVGIVEPLPRIPNAQGARGMIEVTLT